MKQGLLNSVLCLGVLVLLGSFIYWCWYLGSKASYEFYYEDKVIQTIEEYMQEKEVSK